MGVRGPIPKRDDQRIRRNKTGEDGLATETVEIQGDVEVPDATFVSETIQDLWDSLPESGESRFFEPSDWAYAKLTLEILDRAMTDGKVSAMMLASVDSMLSKLLLTEGDRRRVKLEVQRTTAEAQVVDIATHLRAALDKTG